MYFFADAVQVGTGTIANVGGAFRASITISAFTRGAHVITGVHGGDANFASSNSLPIVQVVQ